MFNFQFSKQRFVSLLLCCVLSVFLLLPGIVMGQETEDAQPDVSDVAAAVTSLDQFSGASPQTLVGRVITFPLGFMGAFALLMYIYAGLLWMFSGGSAEKTHKSLQIIIWTSLGVIAAMASYMVVRTIFDAFGA